ncbi:TPA: hypothetical protein KDZ68_003417 [Vibrio parahaemolyticus]|nr:hypothetical protein [Vibrio parahaemolyticus]
MNNDTHFELYSRHKGFKVSLSALLQCLRIAEVYGHTAQIDETWWQTIQRLYPRLEMKPEQLSGLDVSTEKGCDEHDNFAEFRLTNEEEECHVDMTTLLTTLHLAEHYDRMPPIGAAWWLDMMNRYTDIIPTIK